jgi:hypothetical protein
MADRGSAITKGSTVTTVNRPTIPEVLDRFRAYRWHEPAWGALHIVLDDGNVKNADVRFCIELARERGDEEGRALAEILLTMTRTQRLKLAGLAYQTHRRDRGRHPC